MIRENDHPEAQKRESGLNAKHVSMSVVSTPEPPTIFKKCNLMRMCEISEKFYTHEVLFKAG